MLRFNQDNMNSRHDEILSFQIAKLSLEKDDIPEMNEEELEQINKQEIEYQITMLEEKLKQMTPNMAAIEEYRKKVSPEGHSHSNRY